MRGTLTKMPRIPAFTTIGQEEKAAVLESLKHPLSGFLGGIQRSSGRFVSGLEAEWAETFGVKHAIACNSATSGLLAACAALGIRKGDVVWTTPFTMSATAACAVFLGAEVRFIDIEPVRYSLDIEQLPVGTRKPKAIIVANIFGHPAYLRRLRMWCDQNNVALIEDNAQSPFAMEDGQYTGTIGHMGVFSLNVHKHIQAGEGGVITTNVDAFAEALRGVVNHGELGSGPVGLNLRMTEPVAAIARAQLRKAPSIIGGRRELADYLTEVFSLMPWVEPSGQDQGCHHVYYLWTARVPVRVRDRLVELLNERGVPVNCGYSKNLCQIFDPSQKCPVTDRINNSMISFEVCAHNLLEHHRRALRTIILQTALDMEKEHAVLR